MKPPFFMEFPTLKMLDLDNISQAYGSLKRFYYRASPVVVWPV